MREIVLSKDKKALVSDADYDFLSKWKWYASLEGRGTKWYAIRWSTKAEHGNQKRFKIRMHRIVMGFYDNRANMVIDHKDGNSLNNQRDNLEIVTQKENMERAPGWKGSRAWNEMRSDYDTV